MCIGCCPVFLQKMSMNFSSVTHGDTFVGSRWCLISSSYIHFGEKNYTHCTHLDNPKEWNLLLKSVPLQEHISHEIELKMSFRCPTKGCSKNWDFLQKMANLTITLFPKKLCIELSSNLSSFWRLALCRTLLISTGQEEERNVFLFSAMWSAVAFSVTMW